MTLEEKQGYLSIIKLNGVASIQDLGRLNNQHLGFSASGAADEYGFRYANALIGNDQNDAAIEVTLGQIQLQTSKDCQISISGADCQASILSLSGKERAVENWQCHELRQGEVIKLQRPDKMLHSYIAIKGGIESKQWLGSRSQTLNELSLGYVGKRLQVSDKFAFNKQTSSSFPDLISHSVKVAINNFYQTQKLTLRFIASELFLSLTPLRQQQFIHQNYNILSDSNRMGYRLSGETPFIHQPQQGNLSKPVNYGAIQLPKNGQPIVLMKERQTIGGYPVVGTVMQTDLFRLSQMRPGTTVNFLPISVEQAQAQLSAFRSRF